MPEYRAACDVDITAGASGEAVCSTGWNSYLVSDTQLAAEVAVADAYAEGSFPPSPGEAINSIDPAVALEYFTAGVFMVGTMWVAGFACRSLLNMIKSL